MVAVSACRGPGEGENEPDRALNEYPDREITLKEHRQDARGAWRTRPGGPSASGGAENVSTSSPCAETRQTCGACD